MSLLLDLDTLKNLECTSTNDIQQNLWLTHTKRTVAHVRMTMAKPGLMPMLWPGTNEMILQP